MKMTPIKGARNVRPRNAHASAHAWFLRPYKDPAVQLLLVAATHIKHPLIDHCRPSTYSKNEGFLSTFVGATGTAVKLSYSGDMVDLQR